MTSVTRENGQLVYEVFGSGDQILLAFHGFGQDRNIFRSWVKTLSSKYTMYAFDLFYHGQSERTYGKLTKEEWSDWLGQFLKQEGIDRFSVLGYSLGGRFALSTAIAQEQRLEELILIGPDGVYLTPWFKLATTPGLRIVFKHLMTHPNHLDKLLDFNDRSKLVNQYVIDFARKEMGDPANRKKVYLAWNHFKTLGYTEKQLISHFDQAPYKKRIIVGDRDQIIHPSYILPIIQKTSGFQTHRLPLKHHELIKSEVASLLLDE